MFSNSGERYDLSGEYVFDCMTPREVQCFLTVRVGMTLQGGMCLAAYHKGRANVLYQ
jgi:hypothetical protein